MQHPEQAFQFFPLAGCSCGGSTCLGERLTARIFNALVGGVACCCGCFFFIFVGKERMPISAKTLKRIRDRFKRFMRKEKAVSRSIESIVVAGILYQSSQFPGLLLLRLS
jgi:hypothetical protein